MPTPPDLAACKTYLGDLADGWTDEEIEAARVAEVAAQARVVRLPAGVNDTYEPDLAEALYRRVAANLSNRALPLGLQSSVSEVGVGFVRTGGGDREVKRLEAPWRRVVVG